jgi:hypothetical protein
MGVHRKAMSEQKFQDFSPSLLLPLIRVWHSSEPRARVSSSYSQVFIKSSENFLKIKWIGREQHGNTKISKLVQLFTWGILFQTICSVPLSIHKQRSQIFFSGDANDMDGKWALSDTSWTFVYVRAVHISQKFYATIETV